MLIVELGRSGLWTDGLGVMTEFSTGVLGLKVTDRDDDLGSVFFRSQAAVEHYELPA